MVKIRFFIIGIVIFIFSGCVSKKEIQLESLSLISQQEVEESYLTQKYVQKNPFGGGCVTKVNQWLNQPNEISDKFLKIVFSSKEKVFFNILEKKGEPPSIYFQADNKRLTLLGLCPLMKKKDKHYINTLYYPISIKDSFNKKISFYLKTSGYFRWKTNEIVITKNMIDKLLKTTKRI